MKDTINSPEDQIYSKLYANRLPIKHKAPKPEQRPLLQSNYAEWLNGYNWSWWATLTFADLQSNITALKKFDKWMRQISCLSLYNTDPFWFVACELGKEFGRLHLHALVGGIPKDFPPEIPEGWWEYSNGWAQVDEFVKEKGAEGYITKYITKDTGEWQIGGAWPGE
tara:strand:- start:160 stop:660 length:501 start_codon:yes stop_codon:yes gene_type:complete